MEMNAPITLELKVYAVEEATGTTAIVTMSMPRGRYPTLDAIKSSIKQAEGELPDGYALMNKADFFNALLQEEHGATERYAMPGSPDFIDEIIEDETDEQP